MNKKIILSAMLSVGLSTPALAAKWDMPTPYGDGTHQTQVAQKFAKEVTAKSGGKLQITVHSGGSLIKHPEIHRAVKSRQVQIGEVFIGRLGNNDPVFKLDNIPFVATTFDSAQKLYEASKPQLAKVMAKEGLTLLYTSPWPAQDLYTKKTSVIDGMVTSPSTGVNNQSWDYVSHFTTINAWIPKNMVFVNTKIFNKLDAATQKVIMDAAANAEAEGWALGRKLAVEHTNILKDKGMVVSAPSEKLQSELRAIGDTMLKEWLAESGSDGQAIIDAFKAN